MLEAKIKVLNINNICIDAGTQVRESIDEAIVKDYAEKMADGAIFPPIQVVFDGINNYLTDGFHRYHAHLKNEKASIEASVINGTLRDAKLLSYSANGTHGLRLSNADKRRAGLAMLDDMEYSGWTNNQIAKHINVSRTYIRNLREELETPKPKTSAKAKPEKKEDEDKPKADLPPIVEEEIPDNRAEEAMQMLSEENEALNKRLAVAAMDATDEEKELASNLITDYVEQIRILNIELVSVKGSRDRFQAENAELKKQVAGLQRHIKKLDQS